MRKHATILPLLPAVVALALGAFIAHGSESREVQADALDKAAMGKLARTGAEIEDAKRRVEAAMKAHRDETAAITSLLRAKHRLLPGEEFVNYDTTRGVFTVAFVGTATVAGK